MRPRSNAINRCGPLIRPAAVLSRFLLAFLALITGAKCDRRRAGSTEFKAAGVRLSAVGLEALLHDAVARVRVSRQLKIVP